jgi:hypothetical protein
LTQAIGRNGGAATLTKLDKFERNAPDATPRSRILSILGDSPEISRFFESEIAVENFLAWIDCAGLDVSIAGTADDFFLEYRACLSPIGVTDLPRLMNLFNLPIGTSETLLTRAVKGAKLPVIRDLILTLTSEPFADQELERLVIGLRVLDAPREAGRLRDFVRQFVRPSVDEAMQGRLNWQTGLLDRADDTGRTPLMRAAERDDVDGAAFLLEVGASPSVRTRTGTALSLAMDRDHGTICRLLMKAGVRPTNADLSFVVNDARTAILRAILEVDPAALARLGTAPMMHAMHARASDRAAVLEIVLSHGRVKPNDWIPLAVDNSDTVSTRVLLTHGASPDLAPHGVSLLRRALRRKDVEMVSLLAARGASTKGCSSRELADLNELIRLDIA